MIYQNLVHQLQHVRAALAAPTTDASRALARQTLPGRIAALVRATPGAPVPDGPIGERLALELCYAVARHRDALDAPAFSELLAAHLEQAYRLRPDLAEALALGACDEAAAAFERTIRPPDEADTAFLRSICVACAAAEDDHNLARDLGLGTPLLARVRSALGTLTAMTETNLETAAGTSSERTCFIPAVEAKLAGAVLALADELASEPDALDHERLARSLADVSPRWRRQPLPCSVASLHQVLTLIGASSALTEAELCARLTPLTEQTDDELAGELAAAEILALDDTSGSRSPRRRWRLGTTGLNLTAAAAARLYAARDDFNATSVVAMPAPYQAALVRIWPRAHLADLALLSATPSCDMRPLTPNALAQAFTRLADSFPAEEVSGWALVRTKDEPSPWLRAASLAAMERFLTQPYVGQTLHEVARSDPSPSVRGAALEILARREISATS